MPGAPAPPRRSSLLRSARQDGLRTLRDHAVPVERWAGLPPSERVGRFPIGTLVDRAEPGFVERYAAVQQQAQQARSA